ncbi:Hypothetical_protein [Hexamita inflata]|uniref:Hypothetical_protein n=1 Tax=Hexamita inflata TaxID=28002 RepID=A0ABP1GX17_9EUKA
MPYTTFRLLQISQETISFSTVLITTLLYPKRNAESTQTQNLAIVNQMLTETIDEMYPLFSLIAKSFPDNLQLSITKDIAGELIQLTKPDEFVLLILYQTNDQRMITSNFGSIIIPDIYYPEAININVLLHTYKSQIVQTKEPTNNYTLIEIFNIESNTFYSLTLKPNKAKEQSYKLLIETPIFDYQVEEVNINR